MGEARIVTESWKERRFELNLTDLFFRAIKTISVAYRNPVHQNLLFAFSETQAFVIATPFSKVYLEKLQKDINPILEDVNIILSGNPENPKVLKTSYKYNVQISKNRYGQIAVANPQNILKELKEVAFLVKQWGIEEGIYLTKPSGRKYGPEAMSSVFEM